LNNFDFSAVPQSPDVGLAPSQQIAMGAPHSYAQDALYQQPLPSPHHQQPLVSPHHHTHLATTTASYFPQPSPVHTSPPAHYNNDPVTAYQTSTQYDQGQVAYQQMPVSYDSQSDPVSAISQQLPQQALYQHQPVTQPEDQGSYHSHSSVSPRSDQYTPYTEARPALQRYNSHPQASLQHLQTSPSNMGRIGPYNYPAAVSHADFSHSSYSSVQIPIHDLTPDVKYMPQPVLGMSRV
jgi:hypothetical protein